MNLHNFLALFLRGVSLLGRFALTFFIVKELSLELQGEYTLLVTTITLLVMLVGFDFYIYSSRRVTKKKERLIFILKNQLYTHAVIFMFVSFLIVVYFYFFENLISIYFVFLMIVLLFFEHLGQELFRMYLILEKTLFANLLLFIRTGIWALVLSMYLFLSEVVALNLETILISWLFSAIFSVIVGLVYFPDINLFFDVKVDKQWIKKGIKVGVVMFISTIGIKIVEYSDRYLIVYFLEKTSLGIYSMFFQLYNLINVVVFTLIISFVYPKIFHAVNDNNKQKILKLKNEIIIKSSGIIILYGVFSWFSLPIILKVINKNELYAHQPIFFILLLGGLFLNISYSYHYVLIAKEKELSIVKSTLFVAVLNIIFNIILIPMFGITGAAISFLTSSILLLLTKMYYYRLTNS